MKFINDFKQFAMRGNVIDMAVGIIIGGAFGKIVSSVVSDIIMPPIGLLVGGVDFKDLNIILKHAEIAADGKVVSPEVVLSYGNFIQTCVDFTIIAFSVFLLIRLISRLNTKKEAEVKATPPAPSAEETLLTEIRDLLKEQKNKL